VTKPNMEKWGPINTGFHEVIIANSVFRKMEFLKAKEDKIEGEEENKGKRN
jgi:hypothetical protein